MDKIIIAEEAQCRKDAKLEGLPPNERKYPNLWTVGES